MKATISKYFGPSTMVTAAFIGPGTVTICTLAGVTGGYTLLWAVVFSVFTTIILQEMTARLGLVTQNGFGEAIRDQLQNPVFRWSAVILIFGAIVIGNAAYEGGNISGAVLGFYELFGALTTEMGGEDISLTPLILGGIAFLILFIGEVKLIEWFLIGLVMVLSLVFITTAVIVEPDIKQILRGMFIPFTGDTDWVLLVGLIGTTVVPYNLFLHASLIKEKYSSVRSLSDLRKENAVAIILGGVISMCIIITSATTLFGSDDIQSAADMAQQLEPLLGSWSGYFLGTGLFAAGISSAITAPLAAAYAARGILGWEAKSLRSFKFRLVWMSILILGMLSSMFGGSPIEIIQFAQVTNGVLLPLVAVFLLYLMNQSKLLGVYTNSVFQNAAGIIVLLVAFALGARSLNSVFQFL